jgi:hypothetical protein
MYPIYGTTDGEPKWFLEYTRGFFASENKPETVTDAPTDNIPPQNYVTRSGREVKPPKRLDDQ